jgi:CheY-like chemotaxis protein
MEALPLGAPAPASVQRLALVADDDAEMRRLIGATLRSSGLAVVELDDGLALLEYLRQSACPALVVTDLQMPGFSGLRVIRYVQRIGLKLPIVLVTAFGNPRVHLEAVRLGAAAVLDKPFSMLALRALATRLIGLS